MKHIFFLFFFFSLILNAATFTDDFSTDTTSQYITEDTWTDGGVGSFSYDGAGERVRVLTGNDVALEFSRALSASTEGSFSINFLPTVYYPSGGVFYLRLIQDDQTYYKIKNTDGYGPGYIRKYVNGTEVDSAVFQNEYTQGSDYTITVSFSPLVTTVEAFGETVTMNSDSSAIAVSSFSVETVQQDAFYDNVVYTESSTPIRIISPLTNHIQADSALIVKAISSSLQNGWGIKFILDEGEFDEQIVIDKIEPYEVVFNDISMDEHKIDIYVVDESDIVQEGDENHDSVQNIGRGDILVAFGDSITDGDGDDLDYDDISSDGRNEGGGFEPMLNDYLSVAKGYPHSIIEEGTGGMTSAEGLQALPAVLLKYPQASSYLILFGTNDSNPVAPVSTAVFKDNMQQMIDLINAAGKKVILAKIPITLGDTTTGDQYTDPDTGRRSETVKVYNLAIDELVADSANNITVTPPDFYTYFKDNYVNEYWDNLHPNGYGYQSMADLWRDALTQ